MILCNFSTMDTWELVASPITFWPRPQLAKHAPLLYWDPENGYNASPVAGSLELWAISS